MSIITPLLIASGLLLVTFLLGLHVASSLGILSISMMYFFADRPLWEMLGLLAWNTNTSFVLVSIPLFVLMGEILLHSGLSERLYAVLSLWLRPIPGGLLHSNIAACATFAAMSGSSVATAATIGSVALPSFRARGYDERLVIGSLAAGGTLGILIPPSINFIIYGVLMEVSIGKLYMAGFVPGFMLSAMFMLVIFTIAVIWPNTAPREPAAPLREQLQAIVHIFPTFAIIFLVLGTIYLGVATPTEAAAFGVVGAFVLAVRTRRLSATVVKNLCVATARTTAMIMLILTSAFILNSVIALLGIPSAIARAVASSGLSQTETMILIIVFYLALGTFMDGFAMMVTTIPVLLPILKTMNIDLVWFGVIAVLLTEAALISPPEGVNLYVIHGLRGAPGQQNTQTMMAVYVGVLPFFVAMLAAIALLMLFPDIALWLPRTMKGG
jgi:tripartite ATP-independent transporter DctM subunit